MALSELDMNKAKLPAVVWLLDDEAQVVESLQWLLQTVGLETRVVASGQDLFNLPLDQQPGCLLMDVRMPLTSGLDLLEALKQQQLLIPSILMSGHADVTMAVRAMKLGAADFFEKPFNDQQLLDSLQAAIEVHRQAIEKQQLLESFKQRLSELTEREKQVMLQLIRGKQAKKIADNLNISPKTVDVHRYNLMQKMQVESLAELVHAALLLGLPLAFESTKENL
ncbi:DNA-binding response regulator [Marinospirillum insulare]|uniref:DNA-binding response regulator n=2 Tax=Marinospirillum insulare TaxID=217169 RepID=A0ABQ6A1M7_9GAMM|nr:DNA-binding response regulator [Marinospirillum insulare]